MQVKISKTLGKLHRIDYRNLNELQGNLKDLSKKNFEKLKKSLAENGFITPFFVWFNPGEANKPYTVDGHQRNRVFNKLKVMNEEGTYDFPYIEIEAADQVEAKKKLLVISSQYGNITQEGFEEFTFDVPEEWLKSSVSFDAIRIDEQPKLEASEDEYQIPEVIITKIKEGDLFEVGPHRLMCGDSRDKETVLRLMGGLKAAMAFTYPPYNVNYSGDGKNTKNTIKNDNMAEKDFRRLLTLSFANYGAILRPTGALYCCYASRTHREFEDALNKAGFEVRNQIIWVKAVASMGWGDYRWKHEPMFYAHLKGNPLEFFGDRKQYTEWSEEPTDIQLLEAAKKMMQVDETGNSTVWRFTRDSNYKHPTQKPVKLVAKAIENSSKEQDIVADFFVGGGTTVVAADQLQRRAFVMDIDPKYCEVTIQRLFASNPSLTIVKNGKDETAKWVEKMS